MPAGFIPPHGGYEDLLSFQKARLVYDATVCFSDRFVDPRSRTHDQMIQAARSGKQNIVEGGQAAGHSKEAELKLTGPARASLEVLLEDYRDYLRVHGLQLWDKDSRQALYARQLGARQDISYEVFRPYLEARSAQVVANLISCLVHQTNYLLANSSASSNATSSLTVAFAST